MKRNTSSFRKVETKISGKNVFWQCLLHSLLVVFRFDCLPLPLHSLRGFWRGVGVCTCCWYWKHQDVLQRKSEVSKHEYVFFLYSWDKSLTGSNLLALVKSPTSDLYHTRCVWHIISPLKSSLTSLNVSFMSKSFHSPKCCLTSG